MKQVERYGRTVWENEEFESQRRDNCMCFKCERMKPGQPDHCIIALKFFEVCKEHSCAFILTRCKGWTPKVEVM